MKKKLSLLMISFLGLVGFVFAAAFEPTEAKETIELTKTNIEAADYITVNPTDKWQANKTYGGITGDFFNMSNGRQMTITVKGVSKIEVFVQNSTAGRKYGVTVGSGNETEITHAGGGVESSGEIETGTSGETTITLAGKDGSVYPVKIVLTKAEAGSGNEGEGGEGESSTVTAKWDWQNETPSTISSVNIQKTTGTVASDVDGIELTVDATCENGKLAAGSNSTGKYAQFNKGTIIKVPVVSNKDKLTVISYPGQYKYTIGGTAASTDEQSYRIRVRLQVEITRLPLM